MSEKILFEHKIIESEGFDKMADPVAAPGPRTGQPKLGAAVPAPVNPNSTQGNTVTTDIAQQAKSVILAQNTISKSLPYMIGFVQPMTASVGYVFGLQQKDKTKIPDAAKPGDDIVVIRKLVETEVREVVLDLTNETAEDIQNLFGDNFPAKYDAFIKSGGELWDGPNGPLARFFLSMAHQRIVSKINKDFIDWLGDTATLKGKATIADWDKMSEVVGVMAELREALYKNTGKSGLYWALVSPKIAAFLSTYYGRQHNSADGYNKGRRIPNGGENGYVTTIGDIEIFQYDYYKKPEVTGGTKADSETDGFIYMGYNGSSGPGTASVYYMPYNEYIVQGGEDYFTGQSNVYYRVRDSWCTNPLDTYDKSIKQPALGTATQAIPGKNKSQYIVKADITFTKNLITP